jgi:hypothetical protein
MPAIQQSDKISADGFIRKWHLVLAPTSRHVGTATRPTIEIAFHPAVAHIPAVYDEYVHFGRRRGASETYVLGIESN